MSNFADPFLELSSIARQVLNDARRELSYIMNGGDPHSTSSDIQMAAVKYAEFSRELYILEQDIYDYLAKKLNIQPPTPADIALCKQIAATVALWTSNNVKAITVINTTTDLLEIYNKSKN
mgnify:CR=1 FL=1